MFDRHRVWGLDLLRALAIWTVIYAHGDRYLFNVVDRHSRWTIDGVTLFFVLSGFLIGGILIRQLEASGTGHQALWHFWRRRWWRTLPPYLAALVITALLAARAGQDLGSVHRYVFFFQNLAWTHPRFFPEAWSLAVEEWFYALLPLAILAAVSLINRSVKHASLMVAVVIVMACTALRCFRVLQGDIVSTSDWDAALRKVVVVRLDSWAWGVIGAWVCHYAHPLWHRYRVGAIFLGIALIALDRAMSHSMAYLQWGTLIIAPVAYLLCLPYCSSLKSCPWSDRPVIHMMARSVSFTALVSYSMYLLHYSTVRAHTDFTAQLLALDSPWSGWLHFAAYVGLSYVAAYLLHIVIERPSLRWRDRVNAPASVLAGR